MPAKKQSSKALKDATNIASPESRSKLTTEAKEVTEDDWKFALLAYYRLAVKKSMSKHLEELNLTQRKKFVTRWQNSGLKQMKGEGIPLEIASAKYDEWLLSWKDLLRKKQQGNRMKGSAKMDCLQVEFFGKVYQQEEGAHLLSNPRIHQVTRVPPFLLLNNQKGLLRWPQSHADGQSQREPKQWWRQEEIRSDSDDATRNTTTDCITIVD